MHLCQTATSVRCQRLLFAFSVTGYTGAIASVYPVPATFVQIVPNGYGCLSILYKSTSYLIYVAFDALNT